jgi:hypothetical protein
LRGDFSGSRRAEKVGIGRIVSMGPEKVDTPRGGGILPLQLEIADTS